MIVILELVVRRRSLFVLLCAFSWPYPGVATPFSFDDIEFWVGTGANRAAVAIDWVEHSTEQPALVWGFRWNGAASGRDMLLAVVTADQRLFAKLGDPPANPVRVFGLGYDADRNGEFGIEDGTTFNDSGIAYSSPPFFPAAASDPDDYYAEGWTFGFWHYGVAGTSPFAGGSWSDSGVGMASRTLSDGAWDSWTFSPTFDFTAFAENPRAAPPPPFAPGDFNRDGRVDAADYAFWRADFGSTAELAADGNGNGVVDAADYVVWRRHLGHGHSSIAAANVIPEPGATGFVLSSLCVLGQIRLLNRKERIS